MSYCRWSTDRFQCDLYCYYSATGYVTHVASMRLVSPGPDPETEPEAWSAWVNGQARQNACDPERVAIGGPCDGESFTDPDLQSFLERLLELRAAGYRFPDSVLDEVRSELAEETHG